MIKAHWRLPLTPLLLSEYAVKTWTKSSKYNFLMKGTKSWKTLFRTFYMNNMII